MTAEETAKLLAACATYDHRKIGALDVVAWHRIIGDLPFADCETAVLAHYADSTDWIMPAHVRRRVLEIRNQRLSATEIPPPPRELLSDPDGYQAALHAAAVAIADGRDPERAMQAVASARLRELEA
jgi:hypothetical protein